MTIALENLSEIHTDVLREVGNIGAGNAMTSLATMLDCKVDMSVPRVSLMSLSEFAQMTGGAEALSVGIYMPVEGEAPGHVAFLLPEQAAMRLVDRLLGRAPGETTELGDLECSALMEVGNILTSSHLMAICDMTGLQLLTCPPALAYDMTAAILSSIAVNFASLEERAVTIVTRIEEASDTMEGYFIYVPEPESLMRILRALGMIEQVTHG
ncbi:MAG: chemotaxis protein CheC [Chloroherpetonaceae bacterium]|nr:chemotaxis protein CheC [Chthonomonadaceae bacterium]MDW8206489.1 chemotaxis protein CheC [Chloroherpetonaceae bacterium]